MIPWLRSFFAAWVKYRWLPNRRSALPRSSICTGPFGDVFRIRTKEFPNDENPDGHQKSFKTVWHAALRRAGVRYFRIYDLRSTYATRRSARGVADEWVTQLFRQGDAKVFKVYSQMKLQMNSRRWPNSTALLMKQGRNLAPVEAREQRKQ